MKALGSGRALTPFPWIVIWNCTNRCNLRCWYCCANLDQQGHEDHAAAKAALLQLRPRAIVTFGGEPLLNPALIDTLAEARTAAPETFVSVNTNAYDEARLLEVLPYVDRLSISIDGLGCVNAKTRGISGDLLLGRIAEVAPRCRRQGSELQTFTVVTTDNWAHLSELITAVRTIDSSIAMFFLLLSPPTHPRSIERYPDMFDNWKTKFELLRQEHGNLFTSSALRHGQKTRCFRQYFICHMDAAGKTFSCRQSVLQRLADHVVAEWEGKGLRSDWATLFCKLLREAARRRVDASCASSCDWFMSMEACLKKEQPLPESMKRMFRAPLPADEMKAVRRLCRNIGLDTDWLTVNGVLNGQKGQQSP